MRVLITYHAPLVSTPVGHYIRGLAGALTSAGHLVHCLTYDDRRGRREEFPVHAVIASTSAKIRDLSFDLPCFRDEQCGERDFESLGENELADYRDAMRRQLDREVDQFNPDIIHVQHVWLQAQLALETGVPYVISAWKSELSAGNGHCRKLAEQAAENAGCIFASSDAAARAVASRFDGAADRTVVVPPAVAERVKHERAARSALLGRIGIVDGRPLVVGLAPGESDGLIDLLNAAARYEPAHPQIQTVVSTGSRQAPELTSIASRLELQGTRIVADLDVDELSLLAAAADVFVLAGREPDTGIEALEAASQETPLVATDAAGLELLVDQQTGAVVPAADHELLADSITSAIHERWKTSKGPQARLRAIGSYGWPVAIEKLLRAYTSVLHNRFGRHS